MDTAEHVDTLVIGAGQAGLSAGYHLARRGHDFLIVDAVARLGDNWRCHWDSLRLYSPARFNRLPGMAFPAPAWTWPTKDEMADFLETYADRFDLPVRTRTTVRRVWRDEAREEYVVEADPHTWRCDNVVVATGTFGRTPYIPDLAAALHPGILQLHSCQYRRPSQLRAGPALVVGASHSGADIAYELAPTHPTILCGRDTGSIPFDIEGKISRHGFRVVWFVGGLLLDVRTPLGRKEQAEVRHHGGPLLRYKTAHLAARGVERVTERVTGVEDGRPRLAGGRVVDVTNVVWATGFRQDFSWIDLPVTGADGWPVERRGVTEFPGLYFTGLAMQSSFRSMLVGGAGADAQYVVEHLVAHRPRRAGASRQTGVHA